MNGQGSEYPNDESESRCSSHPPNNALSSWKRKTRAASKIEPSAMNGRAAAGKLKKELDQLKHEPVIAKR